MILTLYLLLGFSQLTNRRCLLRALQQHGETEKRKKKKENGLLVVWMMLIIC